jgi:hypothetical protein
MKEHAIMEKTFSVWFVPRLYNEDQKANRDTENIRGLNLAAVKSTTVQVTRLLL